VSSTRRLRARPRVGGVAASLVRPEARLADAPQQITGGGYHRGGHERCRGDQVIQAVTGKAPPEAHTERRREDGNAASRRLAREDLVNVWWPPH
jgi:hypothetical protein